MTHPLTGHSLLGIFAHPDDESIACGGLLAWAADLGVRVTVLSATRGEAGTRAGDEQSEEPLGAARARELHAAAKTLGIAEVIILDHADGMLPWTDAARLEADIRGAIQRLRPDIVVTFGEDGLYWHPDHIAVHERTTAVVAALGPAPALYYVTMPPGRMRAVAAAGAAAAGRPGGRSSVLGVADVDAFGSNAAPPTLVLDAGGFAERKLAAIRCHRTQIAGEPLELVAPADAARLLGTEHFRRAEVGSRGETFLDRLATLAVHR